MSAPAWSKVLDRYRKSGIVDVFGMADHIAELEAQLATATADAVRRALIDANGLNEALLGRLLNAERERDEARRGAAGAGCGHRCAVCLRRCGASQATGREG